MTAITKSTLAQQKFATATMMTAMASVTKVSVQFGTLIWMVTAMEMLPMHKRLVPNLLHL